MANEDRKIVMVEMDSYALAAVLRAAQLTRLRLRVVHPELAAGVDELAEEMRRHGIADPVGHGNHLPYVKVGS